MDATTAASPSSGGATVSTRDRLLAMLGAFAGALAVSGSLLTWATIQKHRRSVTVRGTSFGAGKLALIAGIVIVVVTVVWIVTSAPRLRAASAVIALAAGAAIAIAIGAGLASGAFTEVPGAAKGAHQQQNRGVTPSPSAPATAIGAAFVPELAESPSAGDRPTGGTFQAMAGGQGRRGKSTLGLGVFIALGGGLLAVVVGIWSLLTGRSQSTAPPPSGGDAAASDAEVPTGSRDPAPGPTNPSQIPIPADPGDG